MKRKMVETVGNYTLAGVVEFYSEYTLQKMGYNYKNLIHHNVPIKAYRKGNSEFLFGIDYHSQKMKLIHPEIISKFWNLEDAKEEFPELFV
jgi:hypothetical protein